MFRIGDFSRIARVSCRLLRHYEELGLIKPARVEPDTGYRYYSAGQLPRLNRILVLKELGLSLEEIGRIIDRHPSADELRGMLLMQRTQAERALAAETQRLRHIETRIAQIDAEGQLDADDVVIRPEPARLLLSVRRELPSFARARELIAELCKSVPRQAGRDALGPLFAIAHAAEFEQDGLDVEFGFILPRRIEPRVRLADGTALRVREEPKVERMAVCVRVGLPEHAHLITSRIGRFVEANGDQLAGPSREVFLQPPVLERMDQSVVEMQFPIAKAAPVNRPG
jgi:DNA-binding transcriptional MerR regulator